MLGFLNVKFLKNCVCFLLQFISATVGLSNQNNMTSEESVNLAVKAVQDLER